MNRRDFLGIAPAGAAFIAGIAHWLPITREALPDQALAYLERERSLQWSGYHWVEVTDGVITAVHNGDEWFVIDAHKSEV